MRFWAIGSLALLLSLSASAQAPAPTKSPAAKPRRVNELTLAGLRPGRDKAAKAIQLLGKPNATSSDNQSLNWFLRDGRGALFLNLDLDRANVVQFIRVWYEEHSELFDPRPASSPRDWQSGRGLAVGVPSSRVLRLYGEPDSHSPSTKDGRKLELLYYAFDWAGNDVPQVMEVLCTVEDDGKPGRVVEITLAAPSL
jgi:hypothetical protein